MYKSIFKLVSLLLVFVFISSFTSNEDVKKRETILKVIIQGVQTNHFVIPQIDNDFSQKTFNLYLERIDFSKSFFIKDDIDKFKDFEYKIDNEIDNATFEFFDLSVKILNERLEEAKTYYTEILEKPFDFDKNESIETDAEKLDYAGSKKELKERWRKSIKYQVMTRVANKLELQEKAAKDQDSVKTIKTFEEIEENARKSVLKSHDNWFRRLSQLNTNDYFSTYINSIINTLDPHTEYFPPKEKEDFDIRMSGRLEGIGATLSEKDGAIEVVNIVPGSASWKQGDLKEGDLILKVAQENEEPVDVVGMRLDEAVKLIRGKKGTKVILTVKKIDGNIEDITIVRDVVIIEETYAKSAIIKDEKTGLKVGIINLPQFYIDFNHPGGRSCADDMKKEIIKLKEEKVDGIVIDLRNNGGGSLDFVIDIAGFFIEKGPIVQVKNRWGAPLVHNDKDASILYDGPLAVMVNNVSASASEIFAAAIQDYNRGIIIGSKSTFGKGTVQSFIELDKYVMLDDPSMKPLGALKITRQKFYRINGNSTQEKGVIPDIILPDIFKYIDYGEAELENHLPYTTIDAVPFDTWKIKNFEKAVDNSTQRVAKDSTFILLDENAKWLKEQRDNTIYSLNLEQYMKEKSEMVEKSKKYKNVQKKIDEIAIYNLKADEKYINADSSRIARMEDWHKNLKKDHYLFEAVQVINDLK